MTLHELNALAPAEAVRILLTCCAAQEWATRVMQSRPFATNGDLLDAADRVWLSLGEPDWLEAFAAHPRIGEHAASFAAQREQSGVTGASDETMQALIEANRQYEKRFGFIFIVFATGKTAQAMLELLRERMNNARPHELRVAAAEQMKITRLRLQRLFNE